MIKKLLFAVLCSISISSYAQWEPLNPKPSYFSSKKVKFVNPQTGYIINNNELLHTLNGGVLWEVKQPLENANDMKFFDSTGYIVCDNGTIYKSTNAGETWSVSQISGSPNLHTVSVIDGNIAFAASENVLYKTIDGGDSWTQVVTTQTIYGITTMCFTSSMVGFIATNDGSIYKTINGGVTWIEKSSSAVSPSGYAVIYFVNPNLGFASHMHSELVRTTDGGETWNVVTDDQMTMLIHDIHFINNSTGYACGEHNAVYKTVNGGQNWERLSTPDYLYISSDLFGIHVMGNQIFTVGMSGGIYMSSDAGSTFTQYSPTYREIRGLAFADATTAYALAINGDVLKSTDTGNTWAIISSVYNPYYAAKGLEFTSATTGYTIVAGGLYKTIDGAQTWNYTTIMNDNIYCVEFIDVNKGFVSGGFNSPATKMTTNGGATWQTINNIRFGKMEFVSPSVGFALTSGYSTSKIYKTIDGGQTWNVILSEEYTIDDFDFTDENTGYVAGNPDALQKTTDGGVTWQGMPNLNYMFTDLIRFADPNIGYVVGSYGQMYKTVDGGDNWVHDTDLAVSNMVFHLENVYAAGWAGLIVGKASGVTLASQEFVDDKFAAYPNPADEHLTILIEGGEIQSVEIFDITGRKLNSVKVTISQSKAFLELHGVTPGIYIATVAISNGTHLSRKIIVQ